MQVHDMGCNWCLVQQCASQHKRHMESEPPHGEEAWGGGFAEVDCRRGT